MKRFSIYLLLIFFSLAALSQENQNLRIGLLKYKGGGDWYANPTSLPNLIQFVNDNLGSGIYSEPETVEVGSPDIFNYPFLHMTGHGNVVFSDFEIENLRNYLFSGGFLHVDDNYGMDQYIRPQIKRLFPEKELVEIGFSHEIYNCKYFFPKGLPKIHEHDNQSPQGFGVFHEGRLILFYSYETDLGDGWEDEAVHGDTYETRLKALKMGANLIYYSFGF
ncbi:MAG: DUF4159 domain-containing protein [Bacteroidota bacterium]|nr:DUF4159 domain-containing protein [Bacteroidota bacterium]